MPGTVMPRYPREMERPAPQMPSSRKPSRKDARQGSR